MHYYRTKSFESKGGGERREHHSWILQSAVREAKPRKQIFFFSGGPRRRWGPETKRRRGPSPGTLRGVLLRRRGSRGPGTFGDASTFGKTHDHSHPISVADSVPADRRPPEPLDSVVAASPEAYSNSFGFGCIWFWKKKEEEKWSGCFWFGCI